MFGGRLFRQILLILGIALVTATPGSARVVSSMVGRPMSLCFAPVRAGQTITDLLTGRIALDCNTPQTHLGAGDFWAVSQPISVRGTVAVRSGSIWQQARTVYGLYGDGVVVARRTDSRRASHTLQLGAIFLDRLPARDTPLVRVAWRIEKSANLRGIVIGAQTATLRESGWANLYMAALYAAFAGLCIALIVHHFALWTAMRHRFQLAYCLMVAVLLGYAFTSSGAAAWVFPAIDNNDRLRFNYIGLGMSASAAIIFARTFFEARVFAGWVDRAMKLIMAMVLSTSFAYAVFAPWQIGLLDKLFGWSFFALIAFVPIFLVRAWRLRSNYLWLFALAWSAPIVFAGLRVANTLNVIGWNFWIDNSTVLSMTVEALLSSLGITYRIRLLGRERDEARVKEIAARALADADSLTGLLNRRAFLRHAIGRQGEQELLILDIDHFKSVNETIGHDGGDEVLLLVARVLRAVAPNDALIARIGGEEFAVLMYARSAAMGGIEGDDVLTRLRAQRMPFDLRVTASIGICRGPLANEADWKRLYRHADRALYEAKADGRDRSRISAEILTAA